MTNEVCWIETVPDREAGDVLRQAYEGAGRSDGSVHNLYRAFSLWPEVIPWADGHYRVLLQSEDTALPRWFLELIGTQVAILNDCVYAFSHHGANFKALLGDAERGEAMLAAVREDRFDDVFEPKEAAILRYGAKLVREPQAVGRADIEAMRAAGASDREILEANQVSANFAYWVRVINGLGIQLGDEKIGAY